MLNRYHEKRTMAIEYLGGKCVECGSRENLEFDHIDPEQKTFDIGDVWSFKDSSFWAEIDKCALRCNEHHRARTILQKRNEHGGGLTGISNCSCELCRARRNARTRELKNLKQAGGL